MNLNTNNKNVAVSYQQALSVNPGRHQILPNLKYTARQWKAAMMYEWNRGTDVRDCLPNTALRSACLLGSTERAPSAALGIIHCPHSPSQSPWKWKGLSKFIVKWMMTSLANAAVEKTHVRHQQGTTHSASTAAQDTSLYVSSRHLKSKEIPVKFISK